MKVYNCYMASYENEVHTRREISVNAYLQDRGEDSGPLSSEI